MKNYKWCCGIAFLMLGIISISGSAETITTRTPEGRTVEVTALTPYILRIDNYTDDERPSDYSTLKKPDTTDGSAFTTENGHGMETTAGLKIFIDPLTGALTISAPEVTMTDSGIRLKKDGKQYIELTTNGTGSFYGAGERGHSFNLKGDTLVMYNRQNYGYTKGDPRISQMNITMPLFISSEGYAVVFDDFAASELILENPIQYITEAGSPISYYFIYGSGKLPSTSKYLSEVTGRQDLPPFWSLGYITSKYGYHDQAETLGVIDTLKREGYPVDGIVLDLYWYGKEEDMGRLAWDPVQWPSPSIMLDSLKKEGVNLVAISQPYVLSNGRGIDNFEFLSERSMLLRDSVGNTHPITIWVGEGGMLDVSNPDTRQWLRDKYRELTETGITGWWGDLGEPEVHPETGYHQNGLTTRLYHNRYGNDWSQIIYDLFKEEYPERRLMTMMRGGTTGLQHYSVFPWSTDVSRSWGGLQPQVTIMLNSGLSGMGYMSHDVGGFAIDPENPRDDELYVRWLQLGLFSPILRTHAQQIAEPYNYTEHRDIILPLIKERYRWLPYNYSLAFENSLSGLPLVRPLEYYSGNTSNDGIDDEFLWGSDVLVAPVMTQGATSRDITFPTGEDRWIDINNTENIYEGGTTVKDYPAPLEVLPLFVREGAFIPTADYPMKNTGDYKTNYYTINYYPLDGSTSNYILYEDDRESTSSIEQEEYLFIMFSGVDNDKEINIWVNSEGGYEGMPREKELKFIVHGVKNNPASVEINGQRISTEYDPNQRSLTFTANYNVDELLSVSIKK